ncbi:MULTISPECIES: hypothetical protein [unclassified Shewanella]|uniref:hypothetical protein n=1 Tax=unclassified Shewanella TaxID=196818 RepID=UPI000C861F99|nr:MULTISPECIES: hypothetical protein [unclassified Shewanella]MDO6641277.1 hypothetical protein [Shewanella sp. 5_MG-2023]MDO6679409.1 hypothetical protein [Shewanella sp. 4_MG-2023]MDO6775375.1 hypothetical protein [Shewanella sp. 3_MG-2023]PMG30404.1 hypothetical protein BCU94_11330 [Shewanella sp. 10N.286.52.C2]PMG51472.1 hypothetical protein BCU91_16420 [Shewanella sp. 10N.286.52.B9]
MRLTLIATFALAISSQAQASVEQQLASCAAQTDKLDRLMCYDTLAASVNTSLTSATTETATAVSTPAVVTASAVTKAAVATSNNPTAEQEFGLKKKVDEDVTRLYADVVSVKKDPYGSLIITLSNNQTWKQSGTDRYKVKKDQTVFVEKGALGSFLLGSDDRNSTIRVKRLK